MFRNWLIQLDLVFKNTAFHIKISCICKFIIVCVTSQKRAAAQSPSSAAEEPGSSVRSSKRSRKPAEQYQSPSIDPLTSKPRRTPAAQQQTQDKTEDLTVFFRSVCNGVPSQVLDLR